jgi:cytochrome P450
MEQGEVLGSRDDAPISYDPRDPAVIQNPIPLLRRLQDTRPVSWSDGLKGWVVTRYDDVRAVQHDEAYSADRLTPFYGSQAGSAQSRIADLIRYLNTWVAFKDPPDHTRLRLHMNRVLTAKVIRDLDAPIREIVADLLDRLDGKGTDRFDFIAAYANPLPASVIMDLLGVPRSDMEVLREWSYMMQPFLGGATVSDSKYDRGREGILAMAGYFREAIRERERRPRTDVISHFVAITQRGEMTEDELIGTCILFLFAGHETTTNLIGNGIRALIAHPQAADALRARPGLIDSAVEEMLRYDGPTGALVRIARTDHELHGQRIRSGDRLFLMINAANHDPRKFDTPERFDIERNPNPHMTFNTGPHFCLGAALARAEARFAILEILRRYKRIALTEPAEYMDTLVMRGVRTMPVVVERF